MSERRLMPAVAAAAFLLHVPFLAVTGGVHYDDAYIFFRYAENVLAGDGWSFVAGHPSAGATSVPWTLVVIAVAAVTGPALPAAIKVVGAALMSTAAGLWAVAVARQVGRPWLGGLAGILIAANPVAVLLAVSGMDTALVLLLLALGALEVQRRDGRPSAWLGLLAGVLFATRPDVGGAFAVACGAAWLASPGVVGRTLSAGRHARDIAAATIAGVVAVAPVMLFGALNSGHPLPPTRTGKLIGRLPLFHDMTYTEFDGLGVAGRVSLAVDHVAALFGTARGGIAMAPGAALLLVGLPVAWLLGARRGHGGDRAWATFLWAHGVVLLLLLCFAFPVPIPRYAAPLIPLGTAGTVIVAAWAALPRLGSATARWGPRTTRRLAAVAALVLLVGVGGVLALTRERFARHAAAQQIRREVGEWLAATTPRDAIVAVEPIGEIGYYSHRALLDLGGLTDAAAWECLVDGYGNAPCLMELFDRRGVSWLVDYPDGDAMSVHPMIERYPERFRLARRFDNGVVVHEVWQVVPASRSGT